MTSAGYQPFAYRCGEGSFGALLGIQDCSVYFALEAELTYISDMPSPNTPSHNPPHLRIVHPDPAAASMPAVGESRRFSIERSPVPAEVLLGLIESLNSATFHSEKGGSWSVQRGGSLAEQLSFIVSTSDFSPATALQLVVFPRDSTKSGLTRIELQVVALDERWASEPFRLNEFGFGTTFIVPRGGEYSFKARLVDAVQSAPVPKPMEQHIVLLQPAQSARLIEAIRGAKLALELPVTLDDRSYGRSPEGFAKPPRGLPPALFMRLDEADPIPHTTTSPGCRVVELTLRSYPWIMTGWEPHEFRVVSVKGNREVLNQIEWKPFPDALSRETKKIAFLQPAGAKGSEFSLQVRAKSLSALRVVK